MDIAHNPLTTTPSVEPSGWPLPAEHGSGAGSAAGPFADLLEGLISGLPPRQDLAAPATSAGISMLNGVMEGGDPAASGAADAVAAPLLQAVPLGPTVQLIIPISAPPDGRSLVEFARAQGLDDQAVEWLLGRSEAPAGRPDGQADGEQWAAGMVGLSSASPSLASFGRPAVPAGSDWAAARYAASATAILGAEPAGRAAGGAPAVNPAAARTAALLQTLAWPTPGSSSAGSSAAHAMPGPAEHALLAQNVPSAVQGNGSAAQLQASQTVAGGTAAPAAVASGMPATAPGNASQHILMSAASVVPAGDGAAPASVPGATGQAAAGAAVAMLSARAAESWTWLTTAPAAGAAAEVDPATADLAPPVTSELAALMPKAGRASVAQTPTPASRAEGRPSTQHAPVEWELDLATELPELSDALNEWLTAGGEVAGAASSAEVDVSTSRLGMVEPASGRGAFAAGSTGAALERPASGEAAQARADQYQALAQRVGEALAQRLVAQIERGHWNVRLTLRPQQLGDVQVDLQMRSGELEAAFRATTSMTRDLIQDSLPRLREVLGQLGMDVAQFHVSAGPGQRHGGNPTPKEAPAGRGTDRPLAVDTAAATAVPPRETRGGPEGWDVRV